MKRVLFCGLDLQHTLMFSSFTRAAPALHFEGETPPGIMRRWGCRWEFLWEDVCHPQQMQKGGDRSRYESQRGRLENWGTWLSI